MTPLERSAKQLQEAVTASAGSVNTMLRTLMNAGFVERRGEPGGRKLWYRIRPGAFSRVLTLRIRLMSELRELAELGLRELGGRKKKADRLIEMRDCYAFFERELPAVVERYEAERTARR